MNKLNTHYSYLQVVEDASPEVIRAAYKYLSQKYHPDKNPNDRERCESIMRALNEAYRILIDPELRKEYDKWIARQRPADKESVQEENKTVNASNTQQDNEQDSNCSKSCVNGGSELVYCRSCGATISKYAKACPSCGRPQGTPKSKTTASLLAILFGGFGLHRFYLGQWWGIFYMLFAWAWVPAIVGFFEGMVFLFTSKKNWEIKYGNVVGGRGLVIVGVILSTIVVGILAAIAIPAFQDYVIKSRVKYVAKFAESLMEDVETYAVINQTWPNEINDIGGLRSLTPANIDDHGVTKNGMVYVVFSESSGLNGKILAFIPSVDDEGYIGWECKAFDIEEKYLPAGCHPEPLNN